MLHASSAYIYFRNFLVSKRVQSKVLSILAMLFEITFAVVFIWSLYQNSILDRNATTLFDFPIVISVVLLIMSVLTFRAGMIALEKKAIKLKELGLPVVFASLAQAVLFIFISLAIFNRY